jgi:23S rRNA (uracil1939-C5)-methyltransferase
MQRVFGMAAGRTRTRSSGRVVEVTIESLGGRGDGVARLDGRPVYVAGGLPGDRLRVRLDQPRGEGFVGRLMETVAPGPGRVPAPCPRYGECGGCALQHLDSELYAAWKSDQVRVALARRGFDAPPLQPLVRIPAATRRRASFAAERSGRSIRVGFHARESHRVVDANGCLIVTPGLTALRSRLIEGLRPLLSDGGRLDVTATELPGGVDLLIAGKDPLSLAGREALAALADAADLARITWQTERTPPEPIAIRRPARMAFGEVPVDVPPGVFVQPSAEGEAVLVATVTRALADCRRIADLYAGCGTFTFPLARGAHVHAVEGDREAIGALAAAARRAGLGERVTPAQRDLADDPLAADELAPFDGVVFDPPRAGARAQCERLAGSSVPIVVAVSCDPATFARDARILVDGGYRLLEVTPVDQFIWSPHVELTAVFRR